MSDEGIPATEQPDAAQQHIDALVERAAVECMLEIAEMRAMAERAGASSYEAELACVRVALYEFGETVCDLIKLGRAGGSIQ